MKRGMKSQRKKRRRGYKSYKSSPVNSRQLSLRQESRGETCPGISLGKRKKERKRRRVIRRRRGKGERIRRTLGEPGPAMMANRGQ